MLKFVVLLIANTSKTELLIPMRRKEPDNIQNIPLKVCN